MAEAERAKRELVIVDCREVKRGVSPKGREWVLYNVVAKTPEGEPIEKELRTFTKLEASDQPQPFEVEVGEFRGTPQYTLHPIRVAKLPERVETLERRILEVEERMARLESAATGSDVGDAPGAAAGPEAW